MSETPLTHKAREAFAAYHDGLGRQIIDALIADVERLTDFSVAVLHIVPPPADGHWLAVHDFADHVKVRMFDEVRRVVYENAECPRVQMNSPKGHTVPKTAPNDQQAGASFPEKT